MEVTNVSSGRMAGVLKKPVPGFRKWVGVNNNPEVGEVMMKKDGNGANKNGVIVSNSHDSEFEGGKIPLKYDDHDHNIHADHDQHQVDLINHDSTRSNENTLIEINYVVTGKHDVVLRAVERRDEESYQEYSRQNMGGTPCPDVSAEEYYQQIRKHTSDLTGAAMLQDAGEVKERLSSIAVVERGDESYPTQSPTRSESGFPTTFTDPPPSSPPVSSSPPSSSVLSVKESLLVEEKDSLHSVATTPQEVEKIPQLGALKPLVVSTNEESEKGVSLRSKRVMVRWMLGLGVQSLHVQLTAKILNCMVEKGKGGVSATSTRNSSRTNNSRIHNDNANGYGDGHGDGHRDANGDGIGDRGDHKDGDRYGDGPCEGVRSVFNEWYNGVALAEVCAALHPLDRVGHKVVVTVGGSGSVGIGSAAPTTATASYGVRPGGCGGIHKTFHLYFCVYSNTL